jgi:hypothetical protein
MRDRRMSAIVVGSLWSFLRPSMKALVSPASLSLGGLGGLVLSAGGRISYRRPFRIRGGRCLLPWSDGHSIWEVLEIN